MAFAVVIWNRKVSSPLLEEQTEAVPIKKLAIDGGVAPDFKCQMQYEQEMWYGMIRSLHGKSSSSVRTVLLAISGIYFVVFSTVSSDELYLPRPHR